MSRVLPEDYSWFPVFFAGVFGSGLVGVAYADNATVDVQERAKKERERIEALIRSQKVGTHCYSVMCLNLRAIAWEIKLQSKFLRDSALLPPPDVSQLLTQWLCI
ncbi:hypothetical protein V8G54_021457 [Vigna mungo]|uniref:Uncharacterized protein n=1 Tax=Vigna mungo TaxID=3915 RepID=A0AAQ3NE94_VIGMU